MHGPRYMCPAACTVILVHEPYTTILQIDVKYAGTPEAAEFQ